MVVVKGGVWASVLRRFFAFCGLREWCVLRTNLTKASWPGASAGAYVPGWFLGAWRLMCARRRFRLRGSPCGKTYLYPE